MIIDFTDMITWQECVRTKLVINPDIRVERFGAARKYSWIDPSILLIMILANVEQKFKGTICSYYADISNSDPIHAICQGKAYGWRGHVKRITCPVYQHPKGIYMGSSTRHV